MVDRPSIQVFGNDGRVALPIGVIPEDGNRTLQTYIRGGDTWVDSREAYELGPAWD